MNWEAKSSGDMTLGVFNEDGFQVVKIDMLKQNTMKANTDGEILCRALNNLFLIASFPKLLLNDLSLIEIMNSLPFNDIEINPLPWQIEYISEKRKLRMLDCNKRLIADREYPKSKPEEYIKIIVQTITDGINYLSKS